MARFFLFFLRVFLDFIYFKGLPRFKKNPTWFFSVKITKASVAFFALNLASFQPVAKNENFLAIYSILFYPITLGGRRGTTHEFATIPFHLDLFSAALVELAKSIPVHSLILSFHLFFCLPLFLFPFTVPCGIVFAKPEDLETWPNHLSFRFLTRVRVRHILQWLLGSFCESPHW